MEELDPGDLAQQYIADNLVIARGGSGQMRTSHVLTIALRHPDPVEARLILDAILQSYERFLDAQFRDVSKEASQLIEDASNKIKNDLLKAQTAYQIFREQSPILGSRADGSAANNNIHFEKFNKTHEVLINVGLDLEVARERLREVELKLVDFSKPGVNKWTKLSLIDRENMARIGVLVTANQQTLAVQDPALAALLPSITAAKAGDEQLQINKLLEISGKKDALLKIFGENHPEIQKVNAELEAVKKLIDARSKQEPLFNEKDFKRPEVIDPDLIMDWYLGMLRSDVKVLERRQQELLEEAAQEEELAKGLLPYELEEDRLRQEVQHAQELYDAVIDRLREVNFAKDYSGFVNEIIVNPAFGEEIWPSVPIVMVVASMFGLLAGVFAAAMTEYRDRTFRDPDDIRRDLGMTLLTHIPSLNSKGIDKRQLVEGSKMHATVYAYHRPKSREAEVFRGLRTSLFFSTQGQKCQVIGMTSPNQGDGKSTVTSNLAVSIAQTGRKVLLVDCDLRRPNVHKLLGISNDVGLSDVIGGEMEPWDAIQQTETTNLWSLPSGPLPANPAELLTSATFEQFIKIAREKYDYILLDCPPVLAVADPCIVAPRTDGMTLVLRVSKDSRPQATRAKEMLERVHARMLGVVVNASQEAHKTGYGRYGEASYAQSYDYGYSSKGYSNYNKYYEEDAAATARSKRTGR
jgi:capsular exopolysaccharide synthesis family protein